MREIWRAIDGYDGMYEVSNLGRVRSFCKSIKSPEIPRILVQGNLRGYRFVNLPRIGRKGRHCPLVHRLVAMAFLGTPTGRTVNHKDLDKANNCVDNLEWMSHVENVRHAAPVIPRLRGEANRSKLAEDQVREIRRLYKVGDVTCDQLGERFGVSRVTAWMIVKRKKWKHLK